MTTKNLRFPILLLVLWLIAAMLLPQSYAAGTLCAEVRQGTGYTADAVGVNQWEGGLAHPVTFRPGLPIARAEAAKLINRVTGRPRAAEPYETTFTDVPATHWAYREIASAANYVR